MPTQIHTSDTDPKQKPLHLIHTLIGATLLVAVLAWGALSTGDISVFIDTSSLIWVVGIVIAGLWMCFGPLTAAKAIAGALFGSRTEDQDTFTLNIAVLARGYQLAWAAGVSGALLGLVIMLINLDDPAAIGPGMALCLLTAIYGLILAEFFFSPLQQLMFSRADVSMTTGSQLSTALKSLLILCIAFTGMLVLVASF